MRLAMMADDMLRFMVRSSYLKGKALVRVYSNSLASVDVSKNCKGVCGMAFARSSIID